MSALEKMREAFETCTVMAGVEPDFECIYITKDAANALFDEAEAENAKLREELADAPKCEACEAMLDCDECLRADGSHKERRRLSAENAKLRELAVLNWEWAHSCCGYNCKMRTNDCGYQIDRECNYEREIWDRMRELGVEV